MEFVPVWHHDFELMISYYIINYRDEKSLEIKNQVTHPTLEWRVLPDWRRNPAPFPLLFFWGDLFFLIFDFFFFLPLVHFFWGTFDTGQAHVQITTGTMEGQQFAL